MCLQRSTCGLRGLSPPLLVSVPVVSGFVESESGIHKSKFHAKLVMSRNVSKFIMAKHTHLFCSLARQLEGNLETCQIKQGLDTHEIGCCQHIKYHVALDVVVCDEILIPLLINDLYIQKSEMNKNTEWSVQQ